MGCPYIEGRNKCCNISITSMVPSLEELTSYCTTDEYDNCPIFLAHILSRSGGRKDVEMYGTVGQL
ncbi:MAG: hypothetical protein ACE5IH_06745 [Thermodesulfobacteriota bacterium]